tara:strand:- start:2 stop:1333 length:1332 start_codon:yes stop_codon:yes gene_type:complete
MSSFAKEELTNVGLTASKLKQEGGAQVYEVADTTDSGTTDALAKKRAMMDARMQSRQTRRDQLDAERQKKRADEADPNQTTAKFWESYKLSQKKVQDALNTVDESLSKDPTPSKKTKASLAELLIPLGQTLDAMQQMAAGAAYYLPPYDSRSAAVTLRGLRKSLTDTKQKVAPKKKFSFKEKRAAAKAAKEKARLVKDQKKLEQISKEEKTDATTSTISKTKTVTTPAPAPSFVVVDYTISNKKNETIDVVPGALEKWAAEEISEAGGESNLGPDGTSSSKSRDVVLKNLEDCIVFLGDTMSALRVTNVKRCQIYGGPVAGSLLLEGCEDCTFWLASRQIRLHHAERCTFHLRVMSNPIIEDCKGLQFAPYNLMYDGLPDMLMKAGLGKTFKDMWSRVQDFKWHRAQHSPNWIEKEDTNTWISESKHDKVTLLKEQLVLADDQ